MRAYSNPEKARKMADLGTELDQFLGIRGEMMRGQEHLNRARPDKSLAALGRQIAMAGN